MGTPMVNSAQHEWHAPRLNDDSAVQAADTPLQKVHSPKTCRRALGCAPVQAAVQIVSGLRGGCVGADELLAQLRRPIAGVSMCRGPSLTVLTQHVCSRQIAQQTSAHRHDPRTDDSRFRSIAAQDGCLRNTTPSSQHYIRQREHAAMRHARKLLVRI